MNVTHLNTFDIKGGAARAAYRLHQGLRGAGVDSKMFVRTKESDNENVVQYRLATQLWERVKRLWRREKIARAFRSYEESRPEGYDLFSDDRSEYGEHVARTCPEADVLNLHWISSFVDLRTLFSETSVPIVWTLHDMNAFTGGCHYNVECTRYQNSCGHCPQLGSVQNNDLSHTVWRRKQSVYEDAIESGRLHIVTPSEWLAEEARRSSLLKDAPIDVIPNGVDPEVFRPRETKGLRKVLDIPPGDRVILFVATSTQVRRKGFDLLAGALNEMEEDSVTLISIGSHEPDLDGVKSHIHLGAVQSDLLLSLFYSLADVFVIPSRQDNLPNTVLESMACGTPVVGYDVGGVSDMVRPQETGWLAETDDVEELSASIRRALLEDATRKQKGKACREVFEEEYTLAKQAERYSRLYESMLRG